jgi:hypothetical protein
VEYPDGKKLKMVKDIYKHFNPEELKGQLRIGDFSDEQKL